MPGPTGAPLQGVPVWAYTSGDVYLGSFRALTEADGSYDLPVTPSQYQIAFIPPTGSGLSMEWFDDARRNAATVVDVAPGQVVDGIDAQLESRMTIP